MLQSPATLPPNHRTPKWKIGKWIWIIVVTIATAPPLLSIVYILVNALNTLVDTIMKTGMQRTDDYSLHL